MYIINFADSWIISAKKLFYIYHYYFPSNTVILAYWNLLSFCVYGFLHKSNAVYQKMTTDDWWRFCCCFVSFVTYSMIDDS